MDLKEYQNVRNALPDVPKVRKDLEAAAQEKQKAGETVQALEEDNSIEAMRAMLARNSTSTERGGRYVEKNNSVFE